MATYKISTKELSIASASAFKESLSLADGRSTKNSTILYALIGRNEEWTNEPTRDEIQTNIQNTEYDIKRKAIGAKKVDAGSVSHVVRRINWVSGTIYDMFRDSTEDMYDKNFYVITDELNVYKCLYNNKRSASTVKPTGFSTLAFTTSDGYTWKYLYTVSLGDANKFLTSSFIPVDTLSTADGSVEGDRQLAVQNAAVNGSIEVVEVNQVGSGYHSSEDIAISAGGKISLILSTGGDSNPSSIDDFYNGSSIYIQSGTGAGQLRRIIDYSGSSRTLFVNTAFSTTPNTDSIAIISPSVTIIGDGSGAKAYARVTGGEISNVSVIDTGSFYTEAKVRITANSIHGTGATANAIISPIGGHGSDAISELGAERLMINVQLNGSEGVSANGNGYIPSNTEFRSVSLLRDPILKVNSNNEAQSVESIANTSNSPSTLRLTTRAQISYVQIEDGEPVNPLVAGDVITNERNRLRAELGELEFVTELGESERINNSLTNAIQGANAQVVYIREDETETDPSFYVAYLNSVLAYNGYAAFTKDDVVLKSTSETSVATVEAIKGPEANTYSGEIVFSENIEVVTRDEDQVEDIKIILDF